MNKQLTSYFSFSKKELNGMLILFFLVTLILAYPFCYRLFDESETYDLTQFHEEIASFQASAVERKKNYTSLKDRIEDRVLDPDYFYFDPNTATSSEWQRLGLSQKQIRVINNYVTKGGKFYRNEDLKKIYSIAEEQYSKLEPYIRIKLDRPYSYKDEKNQENKDYGSEVKKSVLLVELNIADSTMLDQLRGIGPAFASRIIRFRNRLGGFYKKEQLMEVYGMDSLRYSQLVNQVVADASSIKKLKVNTATFEDLRHHPYLTYKQINAVIQYRKQHGNYSSANDLGKVLILNEEIIRKIEPYISFDP